MRLYLVSPTHLLPDGRPVKSVRYWTSGITLPDLKALTPPGHEVTLCDELMQGQDADLAGAWDLVGITAMGPQISRAFELADLFRARDRKVVLGGPWVTLDPDEAQEHADAVVVGEAEGVWSSVVSDAAKGRLRQRYVAAPADLAQAPAIDYRELPLLDEEVFARSPFYRWYFHWPVWTSRGCPHHCSFCAVTAAYRGEYRTRPIEHVLHDLQEIRRRGGRRVLILDDNPIGDRGHALELFRAMAPLRMQWASQCTIEIAHDDELLELAARSGCRTLTIGLESISSSTLRRTGKGFARAEEYTRDLRRIRRHGIQVIGLFMVGLDGDGPESFEAMLRFCVDNQIAFLKLFTPCPFPGTRFHREMARHGRILTRDWNRYDYGSAIVQPLAMSPDEMLQGFDQLYRDFYHPSSIIRRFFPPAPGNYAEGLFYAIANFKVAYFLLTNPHRFGTISGVHAGTAERIRTVWRGVQAAIGLPTPPLPGAAPGTAAATAEHPAAATAEPPPPVTASEAKLSGR